MSINSLKNEPHLDDELREFVERMEKTSIDKDNVESIYDEFVYLDLVQDIEEVFRLGMMETPLTPDYSRHYESRSVAAKLFDSSWVGWTYWYGGGKHADPGSILWMEDAYDLEVIETEKLVTVREFKIKTNF